MIHKLFTQLDIAALVDMLKQQHRYGMAPVIDELVSDMIGLLKQGQQMGKTLPIRIIIAALLPVLGKIAKAVEPTHEQRSALIAELLSKVGAQFAYQGAQAKVIDQQQVQELMGLVQKFVLRLAPRSSRDGQATQ